MELALVISSRCNVMCDHCTTSCGPHASTALSREDIFRLMDAAAEIEDGQPLFFHITGGEPFLDFELLQDVVRHGGKLAGGVSCVTNAYWARTSESATRKLELLRDAGLTVLSVSISRFHQQFLPLDRARIALEVAGALGVATELKGAVTAADLEPDGLVSQWKERLTADRVNIFPVLPYLREGVSLPDEGYVREDGLPTQPCPSEIVSIESDGTALSCCSQGPSSRFLEIGHVSEQTLPEIHFRFAHRGKQRILRERGPFAFAQAAKAAGLGHLLRERYAGPCDLCIHIGSDPRLRQVAENFSLSQS